MVGFYERRWSASARWCERIALICLPYFGLSALLHRLEAITTPQLIWLLAFGLVMILASLFLGTRALFDLWNKGARGGKATVRGVVIATLLLVPYAWHGFLAVNHPLLSDVATNPYAPAPFVEAQKLRNDLAGRGINPLANYTSDYADTLIAQYPKIGSRRFNAGHERVFAAVRQLLTERNWQVTQTRGLPQEPVEAETETETSEGDAAAPAKNRKKPAKGTDASQADPEDLLQAAVVVPNIEIEAIVSSLIFSFKNDVVIQIVAEPEATIVDMRASSRYGAHDFGYDAKLIERFLADLDTSLLGIAGEG